MKRTLIACLALATLTITSCKKDSNEETAVTPTKENLAGTYTIAKITKGMDNVPEKDVTNEILSEACQRDDSYTLTSAGTFSINDDGDQCSTTRTPTYGTWELNASSKIVIDGDDYSIVSFNGKQLVVASIESSGGFTVTTKTTYNKK